MLEISRGAPNICVSFIESLLPVEREEVTVVDEMTVMSKYDQNESRGSKGITNEKRMLELHASPNALLIGRLTPQSCLSERIRQVSFVEHQSER